MSEESLEILFHILDARIDNATDASSRHAWTSARDIVRYAVLDNIECLRQFDYLSTQKEIMINEIKEACEKFGATVVCSKDFMTKK